MARTRLATYCIVATAAVVTLAALFAFHGPLPGLVGVEIAAWTVSPYVALALLASVFVKTRAQRVTVLVGAATISFFGLVSLADGLLLRTGILVDTDPQITHLLFLFLPIHQGVGCLLTAIVALFMCLLNYISLRCGSDGS